MKSAVMTLRKNKPGVGVENFTPLTSGAIQKGDEYWHQFCKAWVTVYFSIGVDVSKFPYLKFRRPIKRAAGGTFRK